MALKLKNLEMALEKGCHFVNCTSRGNLQKKQKTFSFQNDTLTGDGLGERGREEKKKKKSSYQLLAVLSWPTLVCKQS